MELESLIKAKSNCMSMPAGTFTLSNLGMFGVDRFDAILPPGQVSNMLLDFKPLP